MAGVRVCAQARRRVAAWRQAERMAQQNDSTLRTSSKQAHIPLQRPSSLRIKGKKPKGNDRAAAPRAPGQLTRAEIRDLQSRELGPEDYDFLLRLDESIERKDLLSEEQASALIETTLDQEECCSICLCDLQNGENVVLLACGHCFHPTCVKEWLVKGRDTCPVCNAKAEQSQ